MAEYYTDDPNIEPPIQISAVITQQDIDERIKRSMKENSVTWLTNYHSLAIQGKAWLLAEPEKAATFLDVAKKTTQYRPGKLYFEQLDIDDEIIDLKPPSDASVKDYNQFRGSSDELYKSLNPMLEPLVAILSSFGVIPAEYQDMMNQFG